MLVIWNERAKPRCERAGAESAVMSSPAKRTRPRSGTRSPASWPISVVLPAPFGPMIACVSPSSTSRSTLSLASSAPNLLVRPRTSSRTLFILAEEQSREAALEEEHREHQQRTQDQLPVLGPARERVFEEQQRERAQHRSGDASDAPRITMNMSSPERVQFMNSGVKYAVWLTSSAPASPHIAPAITNAASRYGYGEKPIERVRASFDLAARTTMPNREFTRRWPRKRNSTRIASTR